MGSGYSTAEYLQNLVSWLETHSGSLLEPSIAVVVYQVSIVRSNTRRNSSDIASDNPFTIRANRKLLGDHYGESHPRVQWNNTWKGRIVVSHFANHSEMCQTDLRNRPEITNHSHAYTT